MPKLHRKLAVTVIFRRFSILRNFTFCNFCQNLVFQTLQEDWETLQQLLYHSIITTTKLLTKPGFRAIFRKLVICKISHFTNFNRSLVYFPWVKRFTTLNLLITLNGINMTPAFLKKGPINSLLKKVVFCEISHFATFPKYFFHLLQAPWTTLHVFKAQIFSYILSHNRLQSELCFKRLYNSLQLMSLINPWPTPGENYYLSWTSHISMNWKVGYIATFWSIKLIAWSLFCWRLSSALAWLWVTAGL